MLKKFLIGTFAVAALAFAMTASAAYDFGTTTLRVGSKGAGVMAVQTVVGATVDGSFGPMTKAKVMAWQASNGLTADGVFGPMSMSKANAGAVVGTYPAGCTSSAGYSSTTGAKCDATVVTTLPAGCLSTSGFSSTTGAKCDGSTTTNNPAVLSGEGTVKDFSIGSTEESSLSEGQDNVEVAAIDVELDNDGALKLDRFDLYMGELNGGTQSSKPWDYFTKATLMADGKTIASMNVDSSGDWSEYDTGTLGTSSQEYRLRFSGLDAVLPSDETTKISVAFDVASNIDTADLSATWQYGTETDSFRFVDGTGFLFTDGKDLADSFTVDAADKGALKIGTATSDPDSRTISVSKSSDTNGEVIGVFTIEETNDVDVNISEMAITLASGSSETITDMVKKLYLYDGSTKVGEESVNGAPVTFDNLDLNIKGDEKVTLTVKADFDDTNDGVRYQNGDTINIASVDLTAYTDEFDNDEGDSGMAETGAYAGQSHGLYAEGIAVNDFSSVKTVVTADNGNNTKLSYAISYKVTAFGADFYLPKTIAITTLGTNGLMYTVYDETAGGVTTALAESVSSISSSADTVAGSGAEAGTSYFKVADGQSETFTATISLTTPAGLAGHYFHIQLGSVGYNVDTTTAADTLPFVLTPAQDFDSQADTLDA